MDILLISIALLTLLSTIPAIVLYKKTKEFRTALKISDDNITALSIQLNDKQLQLENIISEHSKLKARADPLWQYIEFHRAVINAEKKLKAADSLAKEKISESQIKAAAIISDARHQAELLVSNADSQVIAITKEARESRLKAKERLDNANNQANQLISNANDNAMRIIITAETRAIEIAGSA